jgi:DNA-binding response OmpR family regulator
MLQCKEQERRQVMDTILIIDGEPFEVSTLERMLDGESYRFETASGGEEAKKVIRRNGEKITTILLDWVLPDVDGVELLRWIKDQPVMNDVEVIVESSEFVPESVKTGIDCGAYYYLTKPFEERQLEAIVRAAVSSYKLKRTVARKVEDTIDAFGLLRTGTFHFRTFDEA